MFIYYVEVMYYYEYEPKPKPKKLVAIADNKQELEKVLNDYVDTELDAFYSSYKIVQMDHVSNCVIEEDW